MWGALPPKVKLDKRQPLLEIDRGKWRRALLVWNPARGSSCRSSGGFGHLRIPLVAW